MIRKLLLVFFFSLLSESVPGQVVAERAARDGNILIVGGEEQSPVYHVFLSNSGDHLRIDNPVPQRSYCVQVINPDGTMKLNTWVWKPVGTTLVDVRHLTPGFYHMRIVSLQDIQFNKLIKF